MSLHHKKLKPLLAITMGDPAGIGPEVIVKALTSTAVWKVCRPLVVGSVQVFEQTVERLKSSLQVVFTSAGFHPPQPTGFRRGTIPGHDPFQKPLRRFPMGKPGKVAGSASMRCIEKAVEMAVAHKVSGIVTAPINKEALHLAGYSYPGHTELLGYLTGTTDFGMMLLGGPLKIVFVTTHLPLQDVPKSLTTARVFGAIRLAHLALVQDFGIPHPTIGVAALNPHAGEHGLFGDEEQRIIGPAVRRARQGGLIVSDPLPADTLFGKAVRGDYDVVVAMYHDQGLIPLKTVAFGECVNVTIGLPIIRTSVDHGTAYDIVGTNTANPDSLIQAIQLAAHLSASRHSL